MNDNLEQGSQTEKTSWSSWIIVGLALFVVAIALSSCGHYQPPGEDLWLAVR